MGEPTDAPHDANWVAAYAMGLASARRRVETCLRELVEAADGRPDRLDQACRRLRELDDFDAGLRQRAERLLAASRDQLDTTPPTPITDGTSASDRLDPLEDGAIDAEGAA